MPGKLCNGTATDSPKLKESKAYCEGRKAAIDGDALGDNPHPVGESDHDAWDAGHASYAGGVGTALPRDCCADLGYDGVP